MLSSEESNCSTVFGSCSNKLCTSTCLRKVEDAIEQQVLPVEKMIEDAIKKYIEEHLRTVLAAHLPPAIAAPLELEAVRMIESVTFSPVVSPIPPLRLLSPSQVQSPITTPIVPLRSLEVCISPTPSLQENASPSL